MTPRTAIPVVIVGGGRVACAVHLPLIQMQPELFELVGVVETDPQRAGPLAREYPGITVFSQLDVAFDKGARALICATPWPTHRAIIMAAMKRGVHVLTEKPASLDPAELGAMLDAERSSEGTVAVGYMKRHDPAADRFIGMVSERLDRLRRISVDIVDPDSARQVAHRLITPLEPSEATRAAGTRAVRAILGEAATGEQMSIYGRGLGGSLIHEINLVHTILSGSPYQLLGRLRYSTYWAGGTAVSSGWWPADDFGVEMSHVRAPQTPGYSAVVEAVTGDSRITLRAPCPYLLEQSMTVTDENGDRVTTYPASPQSNGFVRQLKRWGASIREQAPALPGLAEAIHDLAVVTEAALVSTGAPR